MISRSPATVLTTLCRAAALPERQRSDAWLLRQFATANDQAAFAALVQRYGRLVLGVCRHVLRHEHDAEDAFQATFLVLAKKASSVLKTEALASWLHGVAYRTAMSAHRTSARRRARESRAARPEQVESPSDAALRDLQALVDDEVQRLPEIYRAPFVLCCLLGKSKAEAAAELSVKEGTVSGRLARARKRLQDQLLLRGLTLSAALAVIALTNKAGAATVPARLAGATLHTALGAMGAASPAVAALAARVLRSFAPAKVKAATALLLAVVLGAAGVGALAFRADAKAPPGGPDAAPPAAREPEVRRDALGDPLPDGALARLGSIRLRQSAPVNAVAFSGDGKLLVSGSGDWRVQVWDPASGRSLRGFGIQTGAVRSLAVSHDGRLLASAGDDDRGLTVHLWMLPVQKELFALKAGDVRAVALAPDEKVLATAGKDGTVRLWDTAMGKPAGALEGHKGAVTAVAYSAEGTALATAGEDGTVRLWDPAKRREVRSMEGHAGAVHAVAFAPDGKALASAGEDGTVRLWDLAGKELRQIKAHEGRALAVAFAPDGKAVVSGGEDGAVRLWDAATGKERRQLTGKGPAVLSVAFAPDGQAVAAGVSDNRVRMWDVSGKEMHATAGHTGPVEDVAFSPDGKLVATAGRDGAVCVWDAAGRKEPRRLTGHAGPVEAVAFSPDSRLLASAGDDASVRLWDVVGGAEPRRLLGNTAAVVSLAFAPDGKTLASGGGDWTVRLWDVAAGREASQLARTEGSAAGVAFTPDGKGLATLDDKSVRLWDVAAGKEMFRLPVGGHAAHQLAFAADGRSLAGPGERGGVRLCEAASGQQRWWRPVTNRVVSLALSPDGRTVAWSEGDWSVHVWDLAADREVGRVDGRQGWVLALGFSPDGKVLASAGSDSTVLLWDVNRMIAPRPPAPPRLTDARLEAEWQSLTGGSDDAAYRALWALAARPGQALPLVRERLKPAAADAHRVARLIGELDDDDYEKRERATAELAKLGAAAAPALRKALEGKPSAEVRVRAGGLLEKLRPAAGSAERLTGTRLLELLERTDTAEARHLLREAADGSPDDWLAAEAKAALVRATGKK